MDLFEYLEKGTEVALVSQHILPFFLEIVRAELTEHLGVNSKETYFPRLAYGCFLVNWIGTEKSFFAEDIASTNCVAHSLLVRVLDGNHEPPIKNEVDHVDLAALGIKFFSFLQLDDLWKVDDKLVGIEADPS